MMNRNEVLQKLSTLKPLLREDGIVLLGIFGSYARNEQSDESDIDILYTLKNPRQFAKKHGGFGAFSKLREIKEDLTKVLGKEIDFVEKSSLSRTGRKYILEELVDV